MTKKSKSNGKKVQPKVPEIVIKKENHTIEYHFTKEEIEVKARELAHGCHELANIQQAKKQVMSEFNDKIEGKQLQISTLSNHVTSGTEMKTVLCEVRKNFSTNIKEYFFEGKLYDTVPMTAADLQIELPLVESEVGNQTEAN